MPGPSSLSDLPISSLLQRQDHLVNETVVRALENEIEEPYPLGKGWARLFASQVRQQAAGEAVPVGEMTAAVVSAGKGGLEPSAVGVGELFQPRFLFMQEDARFRGIVARPALQNRKAKLDAIAGLGASFGEDVPGPGERAGPGRQPRAGRPQLGPGRQIGACFGQQSVGVDRLIAGHECVGSKQQRGNRLAGHGGGDGQRIVQLLPVALALFRQERQVALEIRTGQQGPGIIGR